ncbi:hypothetical protein ACVWW9_000208 [Agrococcus sp. UYP33]
MTDFDGTAQQHPVLVDPASRRGKAWTEEDYTDLMRGCRSDSDVVDLARQLGRSVQSVQSQLRRLLPADERHLPLDLALPRLRQLDIDGDYDWLEALAKRTPSPWDPNPLVVTDPDARGLGGLTDDELLSVALSIVISGQECPADLLRRLGRELRRRGMLEQLERGAAMAHREALDRLREPDWPYGAFTPGSEPPTWPM